MYVCIYVCMYVCMWVCMYVCRHRVTAASSGTHTHAGARVQASRPCAHWRARLRGTEATGGRPRRHRRWYRRGSPWRMYMRVYSSTSTFMYSCGFKALSWCMPTYKSMYAYMYLCMYVYKYVRMYVFVCVYTARLPLFFIGVESNL